MRRILLAALVGLAFLAPAQALVRSGVQIDAPIISVENLRPDDPAKPWYVEGGPAVETFHQYLRPAPVHWDYFGDAELMLDADDAIDAQTLAPSSSFVIVGDRYAPSLTFTAGAHSRVTVQAGYTLQTAIDGESFAGPNLPEAFAGFELSLVAINNIAFDETVLDYSYELLAVTGDSASMTGDAASKAGFSSGILSASFDNASDSEVVFAFRGEMVAWGRSADAMPSPVPEPSSALLLLAGLGAVVGVQRLRRKG